MHQFMKCNLLGYFAKFVLLVGPHMFCLFCKCRHLSPCLFVFQLVHFRCMCHCHILVNSFVSLQVRRDPTLFFVDPPHCFQLQWTRSSSPSFFSFLCLVRHIWMPKVYSLNHGSPAFLLMPLRGKLVQTWSCLHQHCVWLLLIIVDVHLNISLVIWLMNFNSMFTLRSWSNLTYNNFQTLQHHVFQLQYITLMIPSNFQKQVIPLYR